MTGSAQNHHLGHLLSSVLNMVTWLLYSCGLFFLTFKRFTAPVDMTGRWIKWRLSCNKKLSYRRGTAWCVVSVEILPIATQQCSNYLYDKSWPNRWYEVGDLVGGNAWYTMCTQTWRNRVGSHCLRCHKQTDDGRVVYITCIPTTCCGKIFKSPQCTNCSLDPAHTH